MGKDAALLEVADLTKAYGRSPVVDAVSFEIGARSVVALAGINGSGKSTLLKCLAGILKYTGSAKVKGRELRGRPAVRRFVGYLPQSVTLPEHVTVYEAIAFFARLRGAELDDLVVPEGFLPGFDQRIGELSGGQRQRVAISISLLGRPPLLLMDEPVANLDEQGRESFWRVLDGLRDDGASALIASPSPRDLGTLPDRVIKLHDGVIASDLLTSNRSEDRGDR